MQDYIEVHRFSSNNKEQLLKDEMCGCFFCLSIFPPAEIEQWLSDPGGTARCPYCGIDSVMGESAGYPISEEFLAKMKKQWFSYICYSREKSRKQKDSERSINRNLSDVFD